MNKVTIWLSSYNHARFLRTSIESILNQTYDNFQLYIIDDCSSDNSWEIIEEYARKDERIITIKHDVNWGYSGFADYLPKMLGEYIAIAHSDDMWEADKLKKQVEILESKDNIAACFTWVQLINDDGDIFHNKAHQLDGVFDQPNRNRYEWLNYFFFNGNCLCHPSVLIRKEAYSKYDLIARGLHGYPDYFKWIRLCMNSDIYILPERLTRFRIHEGEINTSGERIENINRIYTEELFVLREYKKLIELCEIEKVFPETRKYIVGGSLVGEYALAQMFFSVPSRVYRLVGLEILYEMFQDKKKKEIVKEKYGYTERDFNTDKQKEDIFNVIPAERLIEITLFANQGNGYSESNAKKKIVLVQKTGKSVVQFDIDESFCERLKGVRLDMGEGVYRKIHIVSISNNNKPVKILGNNAYKNGTWDEFYTLDPQYEVSKLKQGNIQIEFLTELLSISEVEAHFSLMRRELMRLRKRRNWKNLKLLKNILRKNKQC